MATLTRQEKAWVKKVNQVLAECPSKRIGFAAHGGRDVVLFDTDLYSDIFREIEKGKGSDFIPAAIRAGATFSDSFIFPGLVESTAG